MPFQCGVGGGLGPGDPLREGHGRDLPGGVRVRVRARVLDRPHPRPVGALPRRPQHRHHARRHQAVPGHRPPHLSSRARVREGPDGVVLRLLLPDGVLHAPRLLPAPPRAQGRSDEETEPPPSALLSRLILTGFHSVCAGFASKFIREALDFKSSMANNRLIRADIAMKIFLHFKG
ncbi:unnamed protein product [Darwinula stevensoni]|uniref:Uncharacterized protein n=1 Tax=Darwinula stevensoni TaxID=69355 RepID=A0A7R8X7C3_9CRUS|nr:unnamed protein product [Darwinula stevensoni]CAG0883070.1 unnamed protein product [Darwinula stevensoni]